MDLELMELKHKASKIGVDLNTVFDIQGFCRENSILAMDSRSIPEGSLVTSANSDIPVYFATHFDPRVVEVFTAPRNAELLGRRTKKGVFGEKTVQFTTMEYTGSIEPYADTSEGGTTGYNANFPTRDAYYFQTISEIGDLESATSAKARINAYGSKQVASAKTLKIAHNYFWLYGVDGMRNYGIMTDPNLPTPDTPTVGVNGNTWDKKTVNEKAADILKLIDGLIVASAENISREDHIILAMSAVQEAYLLQANDFGITAIEQIKRFAPNVEIVRIPEFNTPTGQLIQAIVPEVHGQPTLELGYIELMRGHGVVRKTSSIVQKNSGSTYGAVIYQHYAIRQMLVA